MQDSRDLISLLRSVKAARERRVERAKWALMILSGCPGGVSSRRGRGTVKRQSGLSRGTHGAHGQCGRRLALSSTDYII